ncbi:hypothetical protein NEFER03_0069 [Nematocida sp. LUAm3]|nr:hypothetical protein NEFER03_0069 [Nematocida sp. LUAm3]KAI5173522.1 hypothetical protein NEFER02_0038 [Nematocida sp. LUAm2]KAI5176743.1 hypothetical protein NEFER01_0068 [Nematocida sp. LUAm1]
MLVEVEQAAMWSRGAFNWFKDYPSYTLQLLSASSNSPITRVSKRTSCRIGLVLDTQDNDAVLEVKIDGEVLHYPVGLGIYSFEVLTKKKKGVVTMRCISSDYFSQHEKDRVSGAEFIRFSSSINVINSESTRIMYNGHTYTVDLEKMETGNYSPILRHQNIRLAYVSSQNIINYTTSESETEDTAFTRKLYRLRSSPKMFISIFSHSFFETSRNKVLDNLYRIYSNYRLKLYLQRRISINFVGEIGEDHGALRKEMFELAAGSLVCDDRFILENGLFDIRGVQELEIIRKSDIKKSLDIPDENFYTFIGFFIGYVIFQQVQVSVRFSRGFYKAILKQKCTLDDLPEGEKKTSLKWMQDNSVDSLGFEFSNGTSVSEGNKEKFISEVIKEETYDKRVGYKYIVQSFHKIVTPEIFDFTADEVSRLVSGVEKISIEYLRNNAIYKRCTPRTKEVQYFWNILEEETDTFRRDVLLFITGTSSLQMINGSEMNEAIVIERVDSPGSLPSAHACFRRIVLYSYATQNELKEKLTYAIKETGGFHFI